MIAHVAGVPLEEIVVAALASTGAGLVGARAWLSTRLGRREDRAA